MQIHYFLFRKELNAREEASASNCPSYAFASASRFSRTARSCGGVNRHMLIRHIRPSGYGFAWQNFFNLSTRNVLGEDSQSLLTLSVANFILYFHTLIWSKLLSWTPACVELATPNVSILGFHVTSSFSKTKNINPCEVLVLSYVRPSKNLAFCIMS